MELNGYIDFDSVGLYRPDESLYAKILRLCREKQQNPDSIKYVNTGRVSIWIPFSKFTSKELVTLCPLSVIEEINLYTGRECELVFGIQILKVMAGAKEQVFHRDYDESDKLHIMAAISLNPEKKLTTILVPGTHLEEVIEIGDARREDAEESWEERSVPANSRFFAFDSHLVHKGAARRMDLGHDDQRVFLHFLPRNINRQLLIDIVYAQGVPRRLVPIKIRKQLESNMYR